MNSGFFTNKFILAPLAGITDTVYRRICRRHGADIVVSEMVSADGIKYGSKGTDQLMAFHESERPIGIQLFGSDPRCMADGAKYAVDTFKPDFIDLNSGCPVRKVIAKNGGAALMKDYRLFERIVTAMVNAVSIPVTVKIRSGWQRGEWNDTLFARIAEDCGAAAITVHPRSKTMGFSGNALWERIAMVKNAVSIPVIGNGDITDPRDAKRMFAQTGCDSVMIGRGVYGNPWIFNQCKAFLKNGEITKVNNRERYETIIAHLNQFCTVFGVDRAAKEMKKHIAWYMKGMTAASAIRNTIFRCGTVEELRIVLDDYFITGHRMTTEAG